MQFIVKDYGNKYKELIVKDGGSTLESGLMTEGERLDLAAKLQTAMYELLDGIQQPEST